MDRTRLRPMTDEEFGPRRERAERVDAEATRLTVLLAAAYAPRGLIPAAT